MEPLTHDAQRLDDWKAYLKWRLLSNSAPMLPTAFVDENFNFFSKELNGIKTLQDRWKRCVANTDARLGEALGQAFVERTFGEKGKNRMQEMVNNLYAALEQDINSLDWMSAETKGRAMEKLKNVRNKIGYPEKWRDYSTYKVTRGDALGNVHRGNEFEFNRQLAKIGKPVDKNEWQMSPPTVNAYYEPTTNDINFPAGILQPPFFDLSLDDAVNYGAIGAVIGHELTHGFDDEGRKYDAYGNLKNWWTDEDNAKFEERAKCISDEYSEFVAVDDVKLNGKLTLGEDTADSGGTRISHMALMKSLDGKEPERIDGFTADQRFFLGWGQIWCQNVTPEFSRLLAQVDPHSPGRYRVNGVVSNMPEFQKAFACKAGQKMVRENACRVW
jgi:putative endopeptidase